MQVSAEGHTVTFNAVAGDSVEIPDPNLRRAIETVLNVAPGTPIAPAAMSTLTRLDAHESNISDLTGLETATNLRICDSWYGNSISDLSALAGLTNLVHLSLWQNQITDISVLGELTHLKYVDLY